MALFVDASKTSSWWYSGGGLYTDVSLVATAPLHVDFDGIDAWSSVNEQAISLDEKLSAPGRAVLRASVASLSATVDLTLDANSTVAGYSGSQQAAVQIEVLDDSGHVVGTATSDAVTVAPGTLVTATTVSVPVPQARLWSVQDPYLYTLRATVLRGGASGTAVDAVEVQVGVRSVSFDSDTGFSLNG